MPVSASVVIGSKIPFLYMTDLILLLDLCFNIKFYIAHIIIKGRAHRYTINPYASFLLNGIIGLNIPDILLFVLMLCFLCPA